MNNEGQKQKQIRNFTEAQWKLFGSWSVADTTLRIRHGGQKKTRKKQTWRNAATAAPKKSIKLTV